MAYEKQTWKSGDVVTSAKLNHIEDGIAANNNVMIVNVEYTDVDTYSADKTYAEMKQRLDNNDCIIFLRKEEKIYILYHYDEFAIYFKYEDIDARGYYQDSDNKLNYSVCEIDNNNNISFFTEIIFGGLVK